MKVYLETDRLILREFTAKDTPLLVLLDSDPEVMRFISDGRPTDPADIRDKVLPRFLDWHERSAVFGYWAAIEKASGEFIGWFHFRPGKVDADGIELGYRLKRSAWGQGYATEGSQGLIAKGRQLPEVQRIYARTLAANRKSRRVMEKLGMRFSHDYLETEFPGEDKSAVVYALLPADMA